MELYHQKLQPSVTIILLRALITVGSDGLNAEIYRATSGNTFQRMLVVNAAFSLEGGSLRLGEWVVPQDNH